MNIKTTAFITSVLHCLAIMVALSFSTQKQEKKEKICVRTVRFIEECTVSKPEIEPVAIQEKPPASEQAVEVIVAATEEQVEQKIEPQPAPPAKKPVPKKVVPKKQAAKPAAKLKPKPKPVSQPKIQTSKKQQSASPSKEESERVKKEAIRKQSLMKEALSALDSAALAVKNVSAPSVDKELQASKIHSLQTEGLIVVSDENTFQNAHERTYYDELVTRLQIALKLPEYGSVKIWLTLSSKGKVVRLDVKEAKSQKNRQYVEKSVPSLLFPSFGNSFGEQTEHLFIIHLKNEMRY